MLVFLVDRDHDARPSRKSACVVLALFEIIVAPGQRKLQLGSTEGAMVRHDCGGTGR